MTNQIRLALLGLATVAVPAFAQTMSPQCGSANFDQARNAFTIMHRAPGAVNQQCYLTVYPAGNAPGEASQNPSSYFAEGTYAIEISGGGGGGGAALKDHLGAGGGAGAASFRTSQYLAPGVYKLTIGSGGAGGDTSGGPAVYGSPSSLTRVSTGQVVAGSSEADAAVRRTNPGQDGSGGMANPGGKNGEHGKQHTGGDGGVAVGSGGAGEKPSPDSVAGRGELGGGGGGARGGQSVAEAGGRGGDGFMRIALTQATPQAMAPVPVAVAQTQAVVEAPIARPARKDRN